MHRMRLERGGSGSGGQRGAGRVWSAEAGRRLSGSGGRGASLRTSLSAAVQEWMDRADSTPVYRRGSGGLWRTVKSCITTATPDRRLKNRAPRRGGGNSSQAARPTGRTAFPCGSCDEEGLPSSCLPDEAPGAGKQAGSERRQAYTTKATARVALVVRAIARQRTELRWRTAQSDLQRQVSNQTSTAWS
jgi:hypothetical protein